jgi:hypothetical protein
MIIVRGVDIYYLLNTETNYSKITEIVTFETWDASSNILTLDNWNLYGFLSDLIESVEEVKVRYGEYPDGIDLSSRYGSEYKVFKVKLKRDYIEIPCREVHDCYAYGRWSHIEYIGTVYNYISFPFLLVGEVEGMNIYGNEFVRYVRGMRGGVGIWGYFPSYYPYDEYCYVVVSERSGREITLSDVRLWNIGVNVLAPWCAFPPFNSFRGVSPGDVRVYWNYSIYEAHFDVKITPDYSGVREENLGGYIVFPSSTGSYTFVFEGSASEIRVPIFAPANRGILQTTYLSYGD